MKNDIQNLLRFDYILRGVYLADVEKQEGVAMVGEMSLNSRQRAYALMSKAEQISKKAKAVFNTPPYHTRDLSKYHDPYMEKEQRQYEEDMAAYNKFFDSIGE